MHGGHRHGLKWIEEAQARTNVPRRILSLLKAIAHALDQLNQYPLLDNWQDDNDISINVTEQEIIITIKKVK